MCFEFLHLITVVSLALAFFSFIFYVSLIVLNSKSKKLTTQAVEKIIGRDSDVRALGANLPETIEAVSKLIDSIVKGGPAMVGMVASILFVFLAIVNENGYLRSPDACKEIASKVVATPAKIATPDASKTPRPLGPLETVDGIKQDAPKSSRP